MSKSPHQFTYNEKLETVLLGMGADPALGGYATALMLSDMKKQIPSGNDIKEMLTTVSKAAESIQLLFIIGGLQLIYDSQKAFAAGWKPTAEQINELKDKLPPDLLAKIDLSKLKSEQAEKPSRNPIDLNQDDDLPNFFTS